MRQLHLRHSRPGTLFVNQRTARIEQQHAADGKVLPQEKRIPINEGPGLNLLRVDRHPGQEFIAPDVVPSTLRSWQTIEIG